jgi:hypothetical protein
MEMLLRPIIEIALALELLLVALEGVWPATRRYLPLGGSHLAQIGLVLALAVATVQIGDSIEVLFPPHPAVASISDRAPRAGWNNRDAPLQPIENVMKGDPRP